MADEKRSDVLYPHNVLEGYGSGALLDLRVRLAIGFLNSSQLFQGLLGRQATQEEVVRLPAYVAGFALELADQVLKQGAELGWVEPLPDPRDTDLDASLRAQAKRTASYNVLQQIEGQKFAASEQGGIIPVAPVLAPRH